MKQETCIRQISSISKLLFFTITLHPNTIQAEIPANLEELKPLRPHFPVASNCEDKEYDEPCTSEEGSYDFNELDSLISQSTKLNLRPENCTSFFHDYKATRRGHRIEDALAKSKFYSSYSETVHNFPVVDFYRYGEVVVVKSKDLLAKEYNSFNGLYQSLLDEADDINKRFESRLEAEGKISAKSNGRTTTIHQREVKSITMHLVVQAGIGSTTQAIQIQRAIDYIEQTYGYKLELLEIP